MGAVLLGASPQAAAVLRHRGLPLAGPGGPKLGARRHPTTAATGAGRRRTDERRVGVLLLTPARRRQGEPSPSGARISAALAKTTAILGQVVLPCTRVALLLAPRVPRAAPGRTSTTEPREARVGGRLGAGDATSRVIDAARTTTAAVEVASARPAQAPLLVVLPTLHY